MLFLLHTPVLQPVDRLYLEVVAEDNVAELKTVKLVLSKTHNPRVRSACEVMERDHTRQLAEVRALGKRFGADLPTGMNPMHQALYESLAKKSGSELDKSFTADQLQDHINDVDEAHGEAELGKTPEVKRFAGSALMTFARHEHIWRGVAQTIGVPSTFGRPTAEQILAGKKIEH